MFGHRLSRRWLAYPALAIPVAAALAANASWARSAGLDVWNLPTLQKQAQAAAEFGQELDATDDDIRQRIAAKESLVADLIAGRATLAEVTSQFVLLNEPHPSYVAVIRNTYPGDTDFEKAARNVIDYVRHRVEDPAERDEVLGRLEAELNQLRVSEGVAAN